MAPHNRPRACELDQQSLRARQVAMDDALGSVGAPASAVLRSSCARGPIGRIHYGFRAGSSVRQQTTFGSFRAKIVGRFLGTKRACFASHGRHSDIERCRRGSQEDREGGPREAGSHPGRRSRRSGRGDWRRRGWIPRPRSFAKRSRHGYPPRTHSAATHSLILSC